SWFSLVSRPRLPINGAGTILSTHDGLRHHAQIKWANGLQYFYLLVAHRGGIELCRRLHCHKRGQLQYVALDHVAQRARGFIKAATPLHAKSFCRRDLHVIDIIAVPEPLKNSI